MSKRRGRKGWWKRGLLCDPDMHDTLWGWAWYRTGAKDPEKATPHPNLSPLQQSFPQVCPRAACPLGMGTGMRKSLDLSSLYLLNPASLLETNGHLFKGFVKTESCFSEYKLHENSDCFLSWFIRHHCPPTPRTGLMYNKYMLNEWVSMEVRDALCYGP